MVDIWGGREVKAGVGVAGAVGEEPVVAADHVGAPVEAAVGGPALEDAVDAAAVLVVGAPVVDDDVGDGFYPAVAQCRDQ